MATNSGGGGGPAPATTKPSKTTKKSNAFDAANNPFGNPFGSAPTTLNLHPNEHASAGLPADFRAFDGQKYIDQGQQALGLTPIDQLQMNGRSPGQEGPNQINAMKAALAQAQGQHLSEAQSVIPTASRGGGLGGGPAGLAAALGQMPSLNMPSGDYNSYLSQAQKALDFNAIDRPYTNAINQVGSDTATSVANIGAMYGAMQNQLQGSNQILNQAADSSNSNNAAVESALAGQSQALAQNSGAANSSTAAALGMGSLQGQLNSSAGQQNAAAQQNLAGSLQNNTAATNATRDLQVADNQNYGRVANAKSQSDTQNAELAAQDAKSQIGLAQGQTDLAAREQASTQAVQMQQNAVQNAIAQYQAQLGGWQANANYGLGLGQLMQGEQGLGLQQQGQQFNQGFQEQQLQASIMGAISQAEQGAYGNISGAELNGLKYGQNQGPLTGQLISTAYQQAQNNPFSQYFNLPGMSQSYLSQNPEIAKSLMGNVPTYKG